MSEPERIVREYRGLNETRIGKGIEKETDASVIRTSYLRRYVSSFELEDLLRRGESR